MTIDTSHYIRSHGHKPRGGQNSLGLWMFTAVRNDACTTIEAHGTYADALKDAKSEARTIGGVETLIVLP